MEENLVLTKESVPSDIERYFRGVLALDQQDKVFSVNLDDVWQLCYPRKDHAVRELKSNFIENVDFIVVPKNGENPQGGRPKDDYYLTSACLEYFVARKVRPVFEVYRRVFHKTAQTFVVPQTFAEALMLAAKQQQSIEEQQRQIEKKNTEIVQLSTTITEMQPKVTYYDTILSNRSCVKVTQIAQDYGMSAQAFNKLLCEHKLQRKVGEQWILYRQFLDKGYVHSKPIPITHHDGSQSFNYLTVWTQKGRIFLYEFLKSNGVLPMIERKDNGETQ